MYPLSVALAIETKELWEEVHACLQPLPVRVVIEEQETTHLESFLERLERMRPDAVLIDISRRREPLEELVRSMRAISPETMIVALNTSSNADMILAALRAGVNEYLFPPLQESLHQALERQSNVRTNRRNGQRGGGKNLAFFSAKGGCGATTIACHVAVELGRHDRKVLLADFDLETGMISFLLKSKSAYSILDAVNNIHRLDANYWKALVSNGIPNLEIIPAPTTPGARQPVGERDIRHVLGFIRTLYDFTILDLGRSLNQFSMDALAEVDEAFLVTTLEVPALHQAKQIIQSLLNAGYSKSRLRLLLNRVPKRMDITTDELEKMLGLPVHSMLPNNYPELYDCYAEGKLLARGSELGRHVSRVTMKLAGIVEDKGKKKFGLFG